MEFALMNDKSTKYRLVRLCFKLNNDIIYDSNIYNIVSENNEILGYISKYKVPTFESCYLDIYIRDEYRNNGLGSTALNKFINEHISEKYKEVLIINYDEDKARFLERNGFEFVEENLNKNLYLRRTKYKEV